MDNKSKVILLLSMLLIASIGIHVTTYYIRPKKLGFDDLYNDFKGNQNLDSRMTAEIHISTDEGACKFGINYRGDSEREVYRIDRGADELCEKYVYSEYASDEVNKEFLNRLLDDDYLERHVK